MNDFILIYWLIVGSVLGIMLSIAGKNTFLGMIAGFAMAPLVPLLLIYAAIVTYIENK